MKDVSIEYAHIYTNQHISDEHQTSLEVLSDVRSSFGDSTSTSLVVMVDDYSFPDPSFSYGEFAIWLESQGQRPDLLVRESQLIPICDEVVNIIEDDLLKQQITDYIKAKKYPCSLFIAAWYLSRLGKLGETIVLSNLHSKRLLNILPESFKPFEDKGLEIIASTRHRGCVNSIEYRFLPGRLIA